MFSTSLIIRETQIKTTRTYHAPAKKAFSQKMQCIIARVGEDAEKNGNLVPSWWEFKMMQPFYYRVFSKNKK